MANRTAKHAVNIHGTDPQNLIEKIIRERIYDCNYWKEECFALNEESLLEKAAGLNFVGGTFGNQKPVPFLCLVLKMLQIQPEKQVVLALLHNEDFKYVRVLAAFYFRLTGSSLEIYKELEPLLVDKRKIRMKMNDGSYSLSFVDELIDRLLREDRVFDIILPRLTKRIVFEESNELEERISPLQYMLDEEVDSNISSAEEEQEEEEEKSKKSVIIEETSSDNLSIEATNALRAKLGLKPLKM